MNKQGALLRKKICAVILSLLTAFTLLPAAAMGAEGDYTPIRTAEELKSIGTTGNYRLMNDIDLTEFTAEGAGWNPIGSKNVYGYTDFKGVFDGNGHTISGMRINITEYPKGAKNIYIGLFSRIGNGGVVKNLHMRNTSITVTESVLCTGFFYCGSIAGYADADQSGNTVISCCSTGGKLDCTVNRNNKDIYTFDGKIESAAHVGGIVGQARKTDITLCYNTADISLSNSYSGTDENHFMGAVGGIIGSSALKAVVSNSYNTGSISLSGCYTGLCAGIAGICCGANHCYNIGKTSCVNCNTISYGIEGSAVKVAMGVARTGAPEHLYFLSGCGEESLGASALTKKQMKNQSSYDDFDFDTVWTIDSSSGYSYPQLRNNMQKTSSGSSFITMLSGLFSRILQFLQNLLSFGRE